MLINTKRDQIAVLVIQNEKGETDSISLNPLGRTTLPAGWKVTEESAKRHSYVRIPKECIGDAKKTDSKAKAPEIKENKKPLSLKSE